MSLVICSPFFCSLSLSPLRPRNSSRSSSIFYSIFSRTFNLLRILVSSFSELVAAVWGLAAITLALEPIISASIAYWSLEAGSCTPPRPPAPQEVIGRAFGFASKEWPAGALDLAGTGVSTKSLCVKVDSVSFLIEPSLFEIFFCEAKDSGGLLTTFLKEIFFSSYFSSLCLLSIWPLSWSILANLLPHALNGHTSPSSFGFSAFFSCSLIN